MVCLYLNLFFIPFAYLHECSKGNLRIMTIAPELERSINVIKWLSIHNVIPSIGHSNAKFDEAIKAFNAGARLATHFFNAMRSFHHRDLGIIGAALNRKDVYIELISDGIHVACGNKVCNQF